MGTIWAHLARLFPPADHLASQVNIARPRPELSLHCHLGYGQSRTLIATRALESKDVFAVEVGWERGYRQAAGPRRVTMLPDEQKLRQRDGQADIRCQLANSTRPLPIARSQSDTITSDAPTRAESRCSAALYAPQYAPHFVELPRRAENWKPHLISCPVGELRPHPSFARHRLSVDTSKLSALAERGDLAFCDPIVITHDRIIIDGYARWVLAKRTGRRLLDCVEHELCLEEALGELIRTHGPSHGLTDFVRIELALDLEPYFQQKALANQLAGGQGKVLSKLTIAQRVDTRREVARIAGVSSGNVRKVKNILTHACPSLLQAAREEEVSINLADKWCLEPEGQQQEYLRRMRIERGIKRTARILVAANLARVSPSTRDRQAIRLSDLVGLLDDIGSIQVEIVDAPGKAIFVTKELIHSLTLQQEVLRG